MRAVLVVGQHLKSSHPKSDWTPSPYRILTEAPVRLSMRGGIISMTLKRGPNNNILLKQETIIIPPFLIGQTNYPATSVMWAVIIPLFFDRRNKCPE